MIRPIHVLVALVPLLITTPLLAQQSRRAPDRVLIGGKVGLLSLESVRGDLQLSDEQTESVRDIARAADEMKRDLEGLIKTVWPEERPAKAAEVSKRLDAYAKEVDKRLKSVLTESQMSRLEEIYIQARDLQALFDPEVAAKLEVTEEQKRQLADLRKKHTDAFNLWAKSEPRASAGIEKRKAWGETRRTFNKEFEDAILATLTQEQHEKFEKIQGKKIDLREEWERENARRARINRAREVPGDSK